MSNGTVTRQVPVYLFNSLNKTVTAFFYSFNMVQVNETVMREVPFIH